MQRVPRCIALPTVGLQPSLGQRVSNRPSSAAHSSISSVSTKSPPLSTVSSMSSPPRGPPSGRRGPPGGDQTSLEERVTKCLAFVNQHAEQGSPQSVLDTIEEFRKTEHMMNVGPLKGAIVDEEIRKKQPLIMAELGGFAGYSAVRFAALQREVAGNAESHYYSFEFSPFFAEIVRGMVEFAGLKDQVTVVVGAFDANFEATLRGKTVDIYFIDHEKELYLSDAKLIVASGTLVPGSLLLADNVLMPGAPDYLQYLEESPQFTTALHKVSFESPWGPMVDAISVGTFLG